MDAVPVIYIEDEETEALLFRLGLNPRGIHVLHIPDSNPESLEALNTEEFKHARAVFFDLWVGVVNGVDLARRLRNQGDKRPFFLLTAGENPNPNALQELNLTYMRKPPEFPKLAEIILALPEPQEND
jgi:DNA-binding response OmpR family regulator